MPDQDGDEFVVSDPELIARVRAGDREAFGELYRRHSGPATTLARQFARSAAESDDLVSESFARVLDNLLAGKGPDTAFRAYLFTTVRNTAYDRTRKDKRLQFTDDMSAHDVAVVGDDPVLANLESGLIATAFAKLPERWQAVLWHTQVEGEIARRGRRAARAWRRARCPRWRSGPGRGCARPTCRPTSRRPPPSGAGRPSSGWARGPAAACRSARRRRSTRTWRTATGAGRWPPNCRRSTPGCAHCWRR